MILPKHLHDRNMKIIDFFGLDHQLFQLTEECAEVIQAVSKLRRAKEDGDRAGIYQAEIDLKKEMVDVLVLFDQAMDRMGMSDEELYYMAAYKIDRQLGRMKKNG